MRSLHQTLFKYGFVPSYFMKIANHALWPSYLIASCVLAYGLYIGLFTVPADTTQGDVFRIIYIHVPLAALSLSLYIATAIGCTLDQMLHLKMASLYAFACACLGLVVTILTIITGMIWAKPTWGTWWVWDARLTSELVLAMLYCGFLIARLNIKPTRLAREVSTYIAWIGTMNIPIVHYSVQWWFTLHQGPSVLQFAKPKMPWIMLYPLIISGLGFSLLCFVIIMHSVKVLLSTKVAE
jgi:heme exporter protein C